MKKTKFLKKIAFPAAPEYADGFVPPAGFGFKMSVSLRGKDIKIYGFTGTQWEMIHNTDGLADDFIGNVLHQKYYFESKTGVEQIVRVSFLSQEEEPDLELNFGTSHESRKFHHIEEVPVYRGGDEGKFLTVRTDGSLAWLGLNESYVVEVIGTGGGESQTPAPTLLSQSVPFGDASYDASTDVMTFDGTGDYATFGGDYAFTDAITVAAWFKTTAGGDRRIMSSHVRQSTQGTNGWIMRLNGGQLKYRHPSGGSGELTGPSGLNNGEWQHVAMTWTPSGYVLYVNGSQHASGGASAADGYDMSFDLHIGANSWRNNSPYAFFNGQIGGAIVENEAMTAEQIQAIYDNGPEYVEVIEPVTEEAPSASAGNIAGLEEHAGLTLHGNAQLIDGVLHFDGTSGTYASLPHSLDYERESGDLTVSMWIKPNSLPSNWNAGLVSKMGSGWSGWITAVSTMDADGPTGNMTQGGLQTSFFGGGNANNRYYPENGIALNEWQHVAFVMVAVGEYKMYHNGVEILSYNPTNRPQSTTGALRFGGWGPFNGYEGFFDGQIDGIKIEKVAKSAEEILGEFNAGSSSEAPAEGGSEAPAGTPNVSAGLEVLETNALAGDAQVTSHEGLLITTDGYTDTQSNYHNGATEQTISAWFKASELGTVTSNTDIQWRNNGHVVAITRDYPSLGRANGFVIAIASNRIRYCGPHISNTVRQVNYDFSVDTWYKIDMTWTSNSQKFYVNGVLVGSASASGSIAGGAFPLRIGRNINSWMSFKGNILGVTVENVAKTANEILSSYQSEVP